MKNAISIIFPIKFINIYLLLLTVSQATFNGSSEILDSTDENNCRPSASVFNNANQLLNHLWSYKFQRNLIEINEINFNVGWTGPECLVKSPPFERNKVTFVNNQPQPIIQKIYINGYFFCEKFEIKLFFDRRNLRDSRCQELCARLGKSYRDQIWSKKLLILKNLDELTAILPVLYEHKLIPDHFIDAVVKLKVFNLCEFRT